MLAKSFYNPVRVFILTFLISSISLFALSGLVNYIKTLRATAEEIPPTNFVEEGANFKGALSNLNITSSGLVLSRNLIENPLFNDENHDHVPDGWAIRRQFYEAQEGGFVNKNNYSLRVKDPEGKEISLDDYPLPFLNKKYSEVFNLKNFDPSALHRNGEFQIIYLDEHEEFFKRSAPVSKEEQANFQKEEKEFKKDGKWQTPGRAPVVMLTASGKGFDGSHMSYFSPSLSQAIELPQPITERTRLQLFLRLRVDEAVNGYIFIKQCFLDEKGKPFVDHLKNVPLATNEEIYNVDGKSPCIREYEDVYYKQTSYNKITNGFADFGYLLAGDGSPDYSKIPSNAHYLILTIGWYFNSEQWQKQVEEYKKEGKEYGVPFACRESYDKGGCKGSVTITDASGNKKAIDYYHPKGRVFIYTPYLYIYGDDLSQPSMPTRLNYQPFYAQSGEYLSPPIDAGRLAQIANFNLEREGVELSDFKVETSFRAANTVDELEKQPFTKDYKTLAGRFFQYKLNLDQTPQTISSLVGKGRPKTGVVKKVEIKFESLAAKQAEIKFGNPNRPLLPAIVAFTFLGNQVKDAEGALNLIQKRSQSSWNPFNYLANANTNQAYFDVQNWKTQRISDFYFKPGDSIALVAWVERLNVFRTKTLRFIVLNSDNKVIFNELVPGKDEKRPVYYHLSFALPAESSPGVYTFKVEALDEKENKAFAETRFTVRSFVPTEEIFGISSPTTYPYRITREQFEKGDFSYVDSAHKRMESLGARRYREWLHFRESFPEKKFLDKGEIEPKYKAMLSYIVESAKKHNLKITANVAAYPLWLNGVEKRKENIAPWLAEHIPFNMFPNPKTDSELYKSFMENYQKGLEILAKAFPYIDEWEIDGEKDFLLFYTPGEKIDYGFQQENDLRTNVKVMADLYYYGRKGIKAGNPQAKVAAPATSFTNYRYIEALYREILLRVNEGPERANPDNYFDIVSWHPYTEEDPTTNVTGVSPFAQNPKIYGVMQQFGDAEKLGAITEFGYQDTKKGLYEKAKPEEAEKVKASRWDGLDFVYTKMTQEELRNKIADFVYKAYTSSQSQFKFLSSLMWFFLDDPTETMPAYSEINGFGLFEKDGKAKPAALMYKRIATAPEIKIDKKEYKKEERVKISGTALGAQKVKFYFPKSLKVVEAEVKDPLNSGSFTAEVTANSLTQGENIVLATKITESSDKTFVESSPSLPLKFIVSTVAPPAPPAPPSPTASPLPATSPPYRVSVTSPPPFSPPTTTSPVSTLSPQPPSAPAGVTTEQASPSVSTKKTTVAKELKPKQPVSKSLTKTLVKTGANLFYILIASFSLSLIVALVRLKRKNVF